MIKYKIIIYTIFQKYLYSKTVSVTKKRWTKIMSQQWL